MLASRRVPALKLGHKATGDCREESMVVPGDRTRLLARCQQAMSTAGFKNLTVNGSLFQIYGDYRKATTMGRLSISLQPAGLDTQVAMRATANTESVYAMLWSPNEKILRAFRQNL